MSRTTQNEGDAREPFLGAWSAWFATNKDEERVTTESRRRGGSVGGTSAMTDRNKRPRTGDNGPDQVSARDLNRLLQTRKLPAVEPPIIPPAADMAALARWRAVLPAGQFRAVAAFVGGAACPRYADCADQLGISPNTLKTHLRRVRLSHPDVWREVAAIRAGQRRARHRAAVRRAEEHSERWHKRQSARRYREQFGCYPWER